MLRYPSCLFCFFFNDTATTEIYTLSLHDALPIWPAHDVVDEVDGDGGGRVVDRDARAGREFAGALAGEAVDEVLADQRLWARLAEDVLAQRLEARLGDLDADQRAVRLAVDIHRRDLARAYAGDLDVGALDHAERVVELDGVGAERLAAAVVADGRRGDEDARGGGEDEPDDEESAHVLLAWEALAQVAVVRRVRLPRVCAVARVVLGAAGAAVALVGRRDGLEGLLAQLQGDGAELTVDQQERVGVDAHARRAAERVVDARVREV